MFDSPADIERAFAAWDYTVPPAIVEQVMETVAPVIAFKVTQDSAPASTRFGGQPFMAKGSQWPLLPTPEEFGEIVEPYPRYDMDRAMARLSS